MMGCGCNSRRDVAKTNAAICRRCPHHGGSMCLLDGQRYTRTVRPASNPCPLGKHTTDGVVRWMGIRWYGVPAPLRWFGPLRRYRLPGCGCIVPLKLAFGWLAERRLLALAIVLGVLAWLAVAAAAVVAATRKGPEYVPDVPEAMAAQPKWASPENERPRGYWYHFKKLTGARAATLPVWSPEPLRDHEWMRW